MVNQKAQDAVQASLDSVTGDKSTGVPGLVFVAVDKNGDEIVANASGKVGDHRTELSCRMSLSDCEINREVWTSTSQ